MRQEGYLLSTTTYLLAFVPISILALLILLSISKERNTSPKNLSEAEEILLKEEQFLERVFSMISRKDDPRRRRRRAEGGDWVELRSFLATFAEAPSLQSPRGK